MELQRINVIAVFLLCQQSFVESAVEECSGEAEYSILGMMLRRHIYKRITGAPLGNVCLQECYRDVRCQSFNYVISQSTCELSNRTKKARPEDFVPNSDRYYFKRDKDRVRLGTLPEMPAESCQEIKASEGEYAVDGTYWLHFSGIGKILRVHCDMTTLDTNECNASVRVCDVNADCQNTRGSYICSCKVGFTGNGKTCTDINECNAYVRLCDFNANCQNTRGSYLCSCNVGFTGDGKTCTDINECSASAGVCDVNANCQNTLGSYLCSCKVGYSGDGKTCTDVNECLGSFSCHAQAQCVNVPGSYSCSCLPGYTGDGKNNCSKNYRAVFTNLGASGRHGPTTLGSHYTGQDHDGQVTLSSGIQQWTVPLRGSFRIEAVGAAGGYGIASNTSQYRGRGARMIGTFDLSKGEIIKILVGQEGGINKIGQSSGGGGGTFVVRGSNAPLIIAGGGGGVEYPYSSHSGCDASTSTVGNPGYRSWSGGSNGHGAQAADNDNSGGGGGGFFSNGRSSRQFGGSMGNGGEGGRGFIQGGVGGRAWYNNAVGGFGGGGGAYGQGGGGGGGGGYSGGSSGDNQHDSCGGGGGSYNNGTNQQNECCYKTASHGHVIITLL